MQDDKSIIFTLVGNSIFTAEFQCKIIAIVMLVIPDRDYKYFLVFAHYLVFWCFRSFPF